MEKEEKIKNKIIEILHDELPDEISSAINIVNSKNQEIEIQDLNNIYKDAKTKIINILVDEYRLPEYEVCNFVEQTIDNNKNYVEKIITKSREDKNIEDIYDASNITKKITENMEFNEEEIAERLNEFNAITSDRISQIIDEDKKEVNIVYQIDDVTTLNTMLEFKKWINNITLGNEEIEYNVKYILNGLKEELINEYKETSARLKNGCEEKINEKIEEAIGECINVLNEKTIDSKEEKDVVKDEKEEIVDRIVSNAKTFKEQTEKLQELENESKKINPASLAFK